MQLLPNLLLGIVSTNRVKELHWIIIVAITAKAIPLRAPNDAPITKHMTVRGCTFGNGSSKTRLAAAAAVMLVRTKISRLAE